MIFALILHTIWIFLIRPFWGNGGIVAKWPTGHSLGSHRPGGRPGHRLGKAGHPVLQSSPSYQIPGEAPHCLVVPKGQNKEILPVQERMLSRHLSYYPTWPEGSSLCLSFCFWWDGHAVSVGSRQGHSVATFPSCLPMPHQVVTGRYNQP